MIKTVIECLDEAEKLAKERQMLSATNIIEIAKLISSIDIGTNISDRLEGINQSLKVLNSINDTLSDIDDGVSNINDTIYKK